MKVTGIKFEYIGVPPGENGSQYYLRVKLMGHIRSLYDEGWPEERTGRKIADQHIRHILMIRVSKS